MKMQKQAAHTETRNDKDQEESTVMCLKLMSETPSMSLKGISENLDGEQQ